MPSLTLGLRSRSAMGDALLLIEDQRAFDFGPDIRPARSTSGNIASVGADYAPTKQKGRSRVPYQIAFNAPSETLVCVRRSRRKEVLFAKNKTGKRGQKRARWSKWSNYKC